MDRISLDKDRLERELSFQAKHLDGKSKLRASLISGNPVLANDEFEESLYDFDDKKEVELLQAEIDRVKSRSRASHHLKEVPTVSESLEDI